MAKKKKKSKAKKKPSLSKLEKETLQLQIEDRHNRIEWRKAIIDIIKEDIQLSQEVFELIQSDKENSILLLEDAIKSQTLRKEEIRSAVPEAYKKIKNLEIEKSQELSKFLVAVNEDKSKALEELDTLQNSVDIIESYDVENGKQKISELEEKCTSYTEDKEEKGAILRRRQEEALQAEVLQIFQEKVRAYQENCSGKLDKNIERIAEETRWWKDSGDILKSMEDSLRQKNSAIKTKIKEEKESLKQRKEKALQISIMVEEQKKEILKIEKRNDELNEKAEKESELLEEQKILVSEREKAKQDLDELNSKFEEYKSVIKYNERYTQNIESKMSTEKLLASDLKTVIEKANILIAEVIFPSCNEIPMPKNILQNLEHLFEEAIKLVFTSQQN